MQWEAVIGLELHAQLDTASKIFSGASTTYGAEPNTQACAIDLGLPGVLPVLNQAAVQMAVKFGLATHSRIARRSVFARKNYFYPDLPKGYQISQYELPIVYGGYIDIEVDGDTVKRIGITRAHLEEDAGKSLHEDVRETSGIDLNRAGIPLLEIVSEPEMRSASEAVTYMRKVHRIVRYLGICDGNMQEGSFRCDANVSVRPIGQTAFGTRTELKNLNSFRFIERAINYEIERQIEVLENGGRVTQETRLYDPDKHETRSMRTKEDANDYRYFPDPDLLPVELDDAFIEEMRRDLPELPDAKKDRFIRDYGLNVDDANVLTGTLELADYFELTVKGSGGEAKLSANWIIRDLTGYLNKTAKDITESPVTARSLGMMIRRISDGTISGKIAKQVFEELCGGEDEPDKIIEAKGLKQIIDPALIEPIIDQVITNNPHQVKQYRDGQEKLFAFFVGQIMKASKGKANPSQVNQLLKKKLETM